MCAGVDEMEESRKSRSGRKQLPDEVRQSEVIRERVTKGMFDSYARLGGKLFLKEVLRLSMVDYREGRRIKATFIPQAWVNDNAIEVDAEGDTVFDVTYLILAMGKDKALLIEDGRDSSDELLRAETVPNWIREWKGPFRVEVKEEIEAYFA